MTETVRKRKDHECGNPNIEVLLHPSQKRGVTWKVTRLSDPSVWTDRPLLTQLCLGEREALDSQEVLPQGREAGEVGFRWWRRLRAAQTLEEAAPWGMLAGKSERAFPVASRASLITGPS